MRFKQDLGKPMIPSWGACKWENKRQNGATSLITEENLRVAESKGSQQPTNPALGGSADYESR